MVLGLPPPVIGGSFLTILTVNTYRVSSTLGVQKYRNIGLNNLKI